MSEQDKQESYDSPKVEGRLLEVFPELKPYEGMYLLELLVDLLRRVQALENNPTNWTNKFF